ncbi:MAG: hypothetical protein KAR24_00855 [Candidatus Pacebacteria bacterium]|nr:hypothetical protein [Candidatus Paceibacterota bacterium]
MTQAKTLQFNKRTISFWSILSAMLLMLLLYTYFLNATILHIVERKTVEQKIAETTIHISELESVYMKLSTEVTPIVAGSLGFVEPDHVIFAHGGTRTGFAKLGE